MSDRQPILVSASVVEGAVRTERSGAAVGITRAASLIPLTLAVLLGATALTGVLYLYPPPSLALVLGGGIGLMALVALTLAKYEAAALLGFLLLGVVFVEPSPPDVVFAVVIAIAAVTGRIELSRVRPVVALLLGTFIALNLVSAFEAIDPARAGLFFSITFYLIVFAVWLCSFVDSPGRARVVVVGYVIAAVASAVVSSLALFVPFPGSEIFLLEGCCRAKGLFQDANAFGPFLVPAAVIVLQEVFEPRLLNVNRLIKVLAVLILLIGVLASFSRGAWINAAIALVVLFVVMAIRRGGARRAGKMLALLLAVGAGIAAVVSLTGSVQFLDQRAALQEYDTSRFSAQRTGIELASTNPVGIGPGQFEDIADISTHSTYVRVLAEQGLVGFAVIFALLMVTLLLATRNALAGRSTYGIGSAALLAAWCGILVNSLVVDTLHWRHLWMIAALIWVGSMWGAPARNELR